MKRHSHFAFGSSLTLGSFQSPRMASAKSDQPQSEVLHELEEVKTHKLH